MKTQRKVAGKQLLTFKLVNDYDDYKRASVVINEIDILKVIGWVKSAWREVTSDTIKHCFEKCGFPTDDYVPTSQDSDEEFQMLFNEICNLTVDLVPSGRSLI